MPRTILAALAALTLSLSSAAAAQRRDPAPDTTYDFEDHDVAGAYRSPAGDVIRARRRGARASLVRPRLHFVPELLKSVERL